MPMRRKPIQRSRAIVSSWNETMSGEDELEGRISIHLTGIVQPARGSFRKPIERRSCLLLGGKRLGGAIGLMGVFLGHPGKLDLETQRITSRPSLP